MKKFADATYWISKISESLKNCETVSSAVINVRCTWKQKAMSKLMIENFIKYSHYWQIFKISFIHFILVLNLNLFKIPFGI